MVSRGSSDLAVVDLAKYAVAETGDDAVRLLDAETLATRTVIATADRPCGLVLTPIRAACWSTHLLSGDVTVIGLTPTPAVVARIPTWENIAPAPGILINPAGTRAYLPQTMAHGQGLNTQFDNSVFPEVSVLNLETLAHQLSEHIS
ncbi:MAG: hypothetical protein Q8N47_07655 [Bryobacterales bacterium]|nr:hypothetical protein [Bryobacterales bacterium]